MNRKYWVIGGISAAVVAAIVLVATLRHGGGSPQKWIAKKYSQTGVGTYRSPKPPPAVAAEINKKHKAIDRVDDLARLGPQGGIFMRYPKLVVGVLPDGTGSRITVDTPSSGYGRYHSHVGGYWASPGTNGWNSRGVGSFRGGGPGSGK
ncbi:DUF4247 domain-containing protein [Actinomadura litoris]|uniref:DUF4247 domain-containing protein n=1 Tax=Actinomadura litoris TaxID=2678616 RepID=A0A7K1L5V5_9ACTN|nr:DUF4247 domain-containing protein [Actinomadura litoris]MUN39811.1 DUF4247 domain-containing protein [Actinomadura litoris]